MRRVLTLTLMFLTLTLTLGCPGTITDLDDDGYSVEQGDCNDQDASIYPRAPDFCDGLDNNCDGAIDPLLDRDGDGAFRFHGVLCTTGADCDDMDPERHPGAEEVCDDEDHNCDGRDYDDLRRFHFLPDQDGDGHGVGVAITICELMRAPEGYASSISGEDCDDSDPSVHPAAPELCDAVDHDCDGDPSPDDLEHRVWIDEDGDGFGAGTVVTTCEAAAPEGFVPASGREDCDDGDPDVSPGAAEQCNGVDDNCDGFVASVEGDADGDGTRSCLDCDDQDASRAPDLAEFCDGVDNDCDGAAELDGDGDGFLACAPFVDAAVGLAGGEDCDDDAATAFPGAPELCDGADQDCDAATDEGLDADGDGVTPCGPDGLGGTADDDCDDGRASSFPGAIETCNGVDDDCDGSLAEDEADADSDGVLRCVDCDDEDATVFPGAPELCDGQSNACGSFVPPLETDPDGDGYVLCAGFADAGLGLLGGDDCDAADATVFPGAPELCDGLDNDCDGEAGPNEVNADGDAVFACDDCDDGDPAVFPGAPELCDGRLNDCDAVSLPTTEVDGDGDGYLACGAFVDAALGLLGGDDCEPTTATVSPGAAELCNGVDDDCSGEPDAFESDLDGDGQRACAECDDTRAEVFVAAPELCDGLDTDCDGVKPADEYDWDFDGYLLCDDYVPLGAQFVLGGGDCDGGNQNIHPGQAEACDGRDMDCADDGEVDVDGDGYIACSDFVNIGLGLLGGDDCDEGAAETWPGAPELCDARDNDCDGAIDAADGDFVGADFDGDLDLGAACGGTDCEDDDPTVHGLDADADGESLCDGDCNDLDPYVRTSALEACDGTDTDCDGLVDTADPSLAADADGDGQLSSGCALGGQDCDDRDPHVFSEDLYTSGPVPDCEPVVRPGFSHEWSHARVSQPSYFFDDSTGMHYLYFRGHQDEPQQVIGVSASADGVTWDAPVGPILSAVPNAWDHRNVSNPSVVRVPSAARPYVMLYHARSPTSDLREIGLASATDPLGPFERLDPSDGVTAITDPVLAPSSQPSYLDSGLVASPSARYDAASGTMHLWYNGRTAANPIHRIFHATSTDLGRTWARSDDDAIPGPDPVFEPVQGWEGSSVAQITWLDDPQNPGAFEYWYTGNGNGIGKSSGDEVHWSPNAAAPILVASAACERMDGKVVSARGIRHDTDTDTYHWYYGAQSDIGGVLCPGNEDPIYANSGQTVSYVASARNAAPAVSAAVSGPVSSDLILVGDVSDNAPDTVVVTVESDIDGFLGTATVAPADPSDLGVQTTGWTLSVTGLSAGTHDLFVDAVDEADTVRTTTLSIVVP